VAVGAGRLSPQYDTERGVLEAGDTPLFATDGLGELLDAEGKALGFDGAAEAVRASAGVPAGQVVERRLARVSALRGTHELSPGALAPASRLGGRHGPAAAFYFFFGYPTDCAKTMIRVGASLRALASGGLSTIARTPVARPSEAQKR